MTRQAGRRDEMPAWLLWLIVAAVLGGVAMLSLTLVAGLHGVASVAAAALGVGGAGQAAAFVVTRTAHAAESSVRKLSSHASLADKVPLITDASPGIVPGLAADCVSQRAPGALTEVTQDTNHDNGFKAWVICPGFHRYRYSRTST